MANGLIINAFTGDHCGCVENRQANEIILTAHDPETGAKPFPGPGEASAQLLEPSGARVHVRQVLTEQAGLIRIRLARLDTDPEVAPGSYLFFVEVTTAGPLHGIALATARIDENLPVEPSSTPLTNGGNS